MDNKYSAESVEGKRPPDIPAIENQDYKGLDEQKADRFGQDTKHRRLLIFWTMIIISVWLTIILAIVVLARHLSDIVLTTLLATTTINVLGLAKIILGNLFPRFYNPRKKK